MSYILDSISSCPIDSECIPIKTCAPIISQLSLAKETEDVERKRKIISQVREKVCGDRRDRLICCPQATPDVVGRSPGNDERYHTYTDHNHLPNCHLFSVKIGSFRNIYHDIGGVAYALDEQNILIKDFTYDGEGPDAFFLAGTSGKPSRLSGDVVLPYPYEGEHFSYSDKNIPLLLRPFDGSEDVVLTLPPGYSTTDLK